MMSASLYYEARCILGESIIYDHRRREIVWVDIEGKTLFVLDDGAHKLTKHRMPELIGFVSLGNNGTYIVGLQTGLFIYDRFKASLSAIHETRNYPSDQLRWNGGKCNPSGDIWAGTMHMDETIKERGGLYILKKTREVSQAIENVSISNGICWHVDIHRMYYIDSPTRQIHVFSYTEKEPYNIHPHRLIDIPDSLGYPYGMTIDEDGMLWVAHMGGGCVGKWHPETGQLINKIDVPAPRVTSCCFGGTDKSRLFVSTARAGLTSSQLKKYPLSGSIFVIDTITKGLESPIFDTTQLN